jgi:hypothetical protein
MIQLYIISAITLLFIIGYAIHPCRRSRPVTSFMSHTPIKNDTTRLVLGVAPSTARQQDSAAHENVHTAEKASKETEREAAKQIQMRAQELQGRLGDTMGSGDAWRSKVLPQKSTRFTEVDPHMDWSQYELWMNNRIVYCAGFSTIWCSTLQTDSGEITAKAHFCYGENLFEWAPSGDTPLRYYAFCEPQPIPSSSYFDDVPFKFKGGPITIVQNASHPLDGVELARMRVQKVEKFQRTLRGHTLRSEDRSI